MIKIVGYWSAPKSGQDLRFDLPTIGPRTVEGAVRDDPGAHRVDEVEPAAAQGAKGRGTERVDE